AERSRELLAIAARDATRGDEQKALPDLREVAQERGRDLHLAQAGSFSAGVAMRTPSSPKLHVGRPTHVAGSPATVAGLPVVASRDSSLMVTCPRDLPNSSGMTSDSAQDARFSISI